tara:strand:- start:532 stop:726 length:195 start_codon:yes stop_codon:yes gene_type:complete
VGQNCAGRRSRARTLATVSELSISQFGPETVLKASQKQSANPSVERTSEAGDEEDRYPDITISV